MLYRLDYHDGDREAVRDPMLGGDLITRHMQTARRRAIEQASGAGRPILITRIAGAGTMKPSLIVEADGSTRRPPSVRAANPREDCKRERGACFCAACRAERKTRREGAIQSED